MTALVVGDVVEVVQTWDTPLSSVAQNVWHLQMVSGAGADSDDLLAPILTQQQVAFAFVSVELSDEFSIVLLELRKWNFATKRFDGVDTLTATGMIGLSATDYEPHGVAALGRIITTVARRQGRTYIPGVQEQQITAGVLSPAMESSLASYLATFDTDISVTGGLFSWCTWNVDPLSVIFETSSIAIQTVIANSLPSYLSKRKPGVGL